MKDWWQSLSAREQNLVTIGGIVLAILFCYFFIWSPLSTAVDDLQQQVSYQQQLATLMHSASPQTKTHKTPVVRKKVTATQLLSIIESSLKQHNLAGFAHHLDETQDGKVQLDFKKVPFDPFLNWIGSLWQEYIFEIVHLTVTPQPETGTVKLTIHLKV